MPNCESKDFRLIVLDGHCTSSFHQPNQYVNGKKITTIKFPQGIH